MLKNFICVFHPLNWHSQHRLYFKIVNTLVRQPSCFRFQNEFLAAFFRTYNSTKGLIKKSPDKAEWIQIITNVWKHTTNPKPVFIEFHHFCIHYVHLMRINALLTLFWFLEAIFITPLPNLKSVTNYVTWYQCVAAGVIYL